MKQEDIFNIFYSKEKKDNYQQFLNIVLEPEKNNLYNYFNEIKDMLNNETDYIKLRGFIVICKLSPLDKENKINNIVAEMLEILDSNKPTIVRMALSSINELLLYKPELANIILNKIKTIDLTKYKDTMSPLIKKDIEYIIEHN